MTALVYLALLFSGVHAACTDYSSKSSCSDADCVWSVVTSGQCIVKSSVDCPLEQCSVEAAPAGCIYTSSIAGQCATPVCGSKSQTQCTAAAACDWTDASKVCTLPDTVQCVVDGEYCTTSPNEGKRSCEFKSYRSVCEREPASLCSSDSIMCSRPGCIRGETSSSCILDPEWACETYDVVVDYPCSADSTNSGQPGCMNNRVYFDCGKIQCNITGQVIKSCDIESRNIGCALVDKPAGCTLKPEVTCSASGDGSCAAGSVCDSVGSVPERCEPDASVQCSASSTGDGCDEDSEVAGCKWVPGTGVCVEKEGSGTEGSSGTVMRTYSVLVTLALIGALFLLN